MADIGDGVRTLIADVLKIDVKEVTDEKDLAKDLGADSLHVMELAARAESAANVNLVGEDGTPKTVGDLVAAVERKVNERQAKK